MQCKCIKCLRAVYKCLHCAIFAVCMYLKCLQCIYTKCVYDKESGEGYKSVPLCHQNSDASQDALKLVPDIPF